MKSIRDIFHRPEFQLALLALASFAIYGLAFVVPYNLPRWWTQPALTIAKITNTDSRAGVLFVLAILALFLLSWLAARLVRRWHTPQAWAIVIAGAVAFNAIMLALYPVDATDVFDYIMRGRIQALYGGNPFYQTTDSSPVFQSDPLYPYTGWRDTTTAYGPWWEMIAGAAARLPGNDVIANVVTFKMVSVLAYAGIAILIGLALRRRDRERALYGVTFFAWNPLVIYSTAGNGHNDAVMMFFAVLGFFFLARGRLTLAALSEMGGALVKFIPALLFPIILLAGLKRLTTWRARLQYLVVTGTASTAMLVISYGHYWRGGDILNEDRRAHMFTTSLATLAKAAIQIRYSPNLADLIVSRAAGLLIVAWLAWHLLVLWRMKSSPRDWDWQPYVSTGVSVLLFYLLVACLYFQPWYTLWPLALAALLPDTWLSRGTLVVTLAGIMKMPIFDFLMGVGPEHALPINQAELEITTGTLGLAWVYFIYEYIQNKLKSPVHALAAHRGRALTRDRRTG